MISSLPDLIITAYDGVQLAVAGGYREIPAKLGQGFIFALWVLVCHLVAAPHLSSKQSSTVKYTKRRQCHTFLQDASTHPRSLRSGHESRSPTACLVPASR